jgi:DNA-binding MarR family transcriptional regulator
VSDELSAEEKAAYRALMRVVFAVPRAVTADISCESGLGLSDHVVLEALAESPDRRLRIGELAAACGVSLSGAVRILNRLSRQGLTERLRDACDRRGAVAVLTAAGQASLATAHAAHVASVRRYIFDHLGDADIARFTASLERMADSLSEARAGGASRLDVQG